MVKWEMQNTEQRDSTQTIEVVTIKATLQQPYFVNGDQKKVHVLNHTMLTRRQWASLFYSSISVLDCIQFTNKCVGPL